MSEASVSDEAICAIIGSAVPRSVAKRGIAPAMSLRGDLGIDSVGLMSIAYVLEEQTHADIFGHVQELIGAELVSDIIKIVREG